MSTDIATIPVDIERHEGVYRCFHPTETERKKDAVVLRLRFNYDLVLVDLCADCERQLEASAKWPLE